MKTRPVREAEHSDNRISQKRENQGNRRGDDKNNSGKIQEKKYMNFLTDRAHPMYNQKT